MLKSRSKNIFFVVTFTFLALTKFRNIYFIFCLVFLSYACDNNDDATIKANPTELFCSEVPETHISEKLLKEPLSHKEVMEFVENKYYKRIAIYNCFTRNDSTFYEIQPRDNIENNLNCLAMIIGGSTYYLNIANDHTTEWEETIGYATATPIMLKRKHSMTFI